jgi:hypothetical protein
MGATLFFAPDGGAWDALREAQRRWGLAARVTRWNEWTDKGMEVTYKVECGHQERGWYIAAAIHTCMIHYGLGDSWAKAFADADRREKEAVRDTPLGVEHVKP